MEREKAGSWKDVEERDKVTGKSEWCVEDHLVKLRYQMALREIHIIPRVILT